MEKLKLLFVITQFYKGGAEIALLNLFKSLSPDCYEVDFLIFDQIEIKSAVSLIPQLPKWINVCNAAQNEGNTAYLKKAITKIYRKLTKRQLYRKNAYNFVNKEHYDYAFSYGEWMSPEFVATKVNADYKAVWIHTDIDKAQFVDDKILFGWDKHFKGYIFVSNLSKKSAINKYPFLYNRSHVIHNMCDDLKIIEKSRESLNFKIEPNIPVLLTVANVRPEKNHIRQIEAMKLLKEQGIDFIWLNIGCAANPFLKHRIDNLIKTYKLENRFLFLGAQSNPYKYMVHSDAVCVLSDFESWSIVITEAKILGIPVIATKTSGAVEQLENGRTGVLCNFSVEDISKKIKVFLMHSEFKSKIHSNVQGFTTKQAVLLEFENFVFKRN
ncbi:glycosyltransferase involved in cell wall biosynthesis [Hydrogenoanaerobacterium saccharovorans]|uniref:Glycosyltransferase involved in cell wall bisynthesis n=1 Tax=Hydrogenoanaerobacterium saccharovorans TaxID=474960 RepID=A0A1H8EF16_9FIRM|nr:glycosyltransferase [Hydrogenoanaerobacterium saccharovorans]RPF42141.1 glycosyltransferase involved in cell wall biosynthesis [Hydrogenoanaerobacterium saccharovorans]SEN18092.1 Glycosyltransferase involved in cell wall bisynthesis [Hydrogenoanaerobacterium saccharovorans]